FFLGMRTSTERRLCSRAPWIQMWSSSRGGIEGGQDSRGATAAYHGRMPAVARPRPLLALLACALCAARLAVAAEPAERPAPAPPEEAAEARAGERRRMVEEQIEARGVRDPRVL